MAHHTHCNCDTWTKVLTHHGHRRHHHHRGRSIASPTPSDIKRSPARGQCRHFSAPRVGTSVRKTTQTCHVVVRPRPYLNNVQARCQARTRYHTAVVLVSRSASFGHHALRQRRHNRRPQKSFRDELIMHPHVHQHVTADRGGACALARLIVVLLLLTLLFEVYTYAPSMQCATHERVRGLGIGRQCGRIMRKGLSSLCT